MRIKKGDRVKIVENHSGHHFAIGTISPEKCAEQWKRYYAEHGAEIRENRMERYWKNREEEIADSKYYRQKKKLMEG